MSLTIGSHMATRCQRTRAYFRELRGEADEATRAAEIQALPQRQWKGKTLYTVRCQGDFGKGPHDLHIQEMWLWSLISLEHFVCPYHR